MVYYKRNEGLFDHPVGVGIPRRGICIGVFVFVKMYAFGISRLNKKLYI